MEQMREAVAVRFDFDGYGYRYMDSGSGSDWLTRKSDAELLYTGDEIDREATALEEARDLRARVETLEAEALEWKTQHENLLSVRQQDLSAMQAKIDGLQKEIAFKNESMRLTKGCPGKVVVRDGFYKIDCYKKKHARQALAGDDHG